MIVHFYLTAYPKVKDIFAIGNKSVEDDTGLVSVVSSNANIDTLFISVPFTKIIIQDAGGNVVVDGSATGKTLTDVVKAINDLVNFKSGGSGVGALTIAKKADGKDAVFADLAALKTYYNTHPKPSSSEAAVVGTTNPDGSVATITMPYVWNSDTSKWDAAATNFQR